MFKWHRGCITIQIEVLTNILFTVFDSIGILQGKISTWQVINKSVSVIWVICVCLCNYLIHIYFTFHKIIWLHIISHLFVRFIQWSRTSYRNVQFLWLNHLRNIRNFSRYLLRAQGCNLAGSVKLVCFIQTILHSLNYLILYWHICTIGITTLLYVGQIWYLKHN